MRYVENVNEEVLYSETSLIRHSMGPENDVGLRGCWIMECLLPYLSMVTVPHIMVGLERMLDYRGVGLARFYSMYIRMGVEHKLVVQLTYLQIAKSLSLLLVAPGG